MYIYIFFPYPNIGLSSLSLFYLAALSFFPCFFAFLYTTLSFFPVPTSYIQPCPIFSLFVCLPCPILLFFFPVTASYTKPYLFFSLFFFRARWYSCVYFLFVVDASFKKSSRGTQKKKHIKGAHFSHFLQNFFSLSHVLLALRSVRMYGCSRSKECLYV